VDRKLAAREEIADSQHDSTGGSPRRDIPGAGSEQFEQNGLCIAGRRLLGVISLQRLDRSPPASLGLRPGACAAMHAAPAIC